jgi:hypothetical protein
MEIAESNKNIIVPSNDSNDLLKAEEIKSKIDLNKYDDVIKDYKRVE